MSENLLQKHGMEPKYIAVIKEILGVDKLTLNPMQEEFVKKGFLKKDNVIIFAPTASGKTLLVHLKYAEILGNGKKRMVYLVPYTRIRKELVRKLARWKKLEIVPTDDYKLYEEGKAQILVATYASLDRLLLFGKKPDADFFVFDEIDMITDDLQGARTESSISRILRESKITSLFALSATIGSPELVERWLGCETFSSDFRPVKLKSKVMEYRSTREPTEVIEEIFASTENKKEPMLVFYYNTKLCRQNGTRLAEYRFRKTARKSNKEVAQAIQEIVDRCDVTSEINDQIKCLNYGVAFYFSRLQPQCKDVIEQLFEKNALDIVFTTPALARGINLPIRTVVIPSPFKYSPHLGNVPISRTEIEQILGRAGRPPYQDMGFGILLSTTNSRTEHFQKTLNGDLETISSKFVQSSPKKGRILNKHRLAVETIKEAKMQNRSEDELMKCFDSYLFMQEIKDKKAFYKILENVISQLMNMNLLDRNIDGEIITPEIVDIIVDSGIDDLSRMLCIMNLSKGIVNNKLEIFSGHIFDDILHSLCEHYGYGIRKVHEKYDSKKIREYITGRTQIEPPKIENEHLLFTALDLYSVGTTLEKIEGEYGLEPDSVPYVAVNLVSKDLILLRKLIKHQCLEDRDKLSFCDYLEICANIMKRGVPYQVLPFIELVDRLGRKKAFRIWEKYGSKEELLKVLGDESRTAEEFKMIKGIGNTLSQRIIEKREQLIRNLQKKITVCGTFS